MALGGLARAWGFGIEVVTSVGRSLADLGRVRAAVQGLKGAIDSLRSGGGQIMQGLQQLGGMATPLAAGLGLAVGYSSSLAETLESSTTAFKIILGSADAAQAHIKSLRDMAASTPFEEGDLISGSLDLLGITGKNVEKNRELLKLAGEMTALTPGKNITEATKALVDAVSGSGFVRLEEFQMKYGVADFAKSGKQGGAKWAEDVIGAIKARIREKTGGQDLLGELSKTTQGKRSTAGDAVKAVLTDFGTQLNQEIMKPLYQGIADGMTEVRPVIARAVRDALDMLLGAWNQYGAPIKDRVVAWWVGLSGGAKEFAVRVGLAALVVTGVFGGLTVGATVLLTALGGLGLVLTGLGTIATGVFGALGAVGAPGLVLMAAAAAALAFALGPVVISLQSMSSVGWAVAGEALQSFGRGLMWLGNVGLALVTGFFSGYLAVVQPVITQMQTRLGPGVDKLMFAFRALFDAIAPGGTQLSDFVSIGEAVGYVFGTVVAAGIEVVTEGIALLVWALTVVVERFGRSILQVRSFATALFGVVTGTLSVSEAVELMMSRVGATVLLGLEVITTGTSAAIAGVVDHLIGFISAIPGLGALASGLESAKASLGGQADAVSRSLREQASGLDARADQIEAARAARMSEAPTLKIDMPTPEVRVQVDGRDIAKAGGDNDVRDGESGKKRRLPPDVRGRVLRAGGNVTSLGAGEVL